MSSKGNPPPYAPKKIIIALFGKRVQLKNIIGKMILHSDCAFDEVSNNVVVETNEKFKVVNTPDLLKDDCLHLDQMIIDFMAHSLPGPNLFILAIDSENSQEEKVVAQINKLQEIFGKNITAHLLIMLQDIECYYSLKQRFGKHLAVPCDCMDRVCLKWFSTTPSFQYDYKNYSEDVVMRRKAALEKIRYDGQSPSHHGREGANAMTPSTSQDSFAATAPEHHIGSSGLPMQVPGEQLGVQCLAQGHFDTGHGAAEDRTGDLPVSGQPSPPSNRAWYASDHIFNIVLLGLSGTGKSASANTILTAGKSKIDSRQLFKSEPSSMPITTQCEVKVVKKPFGTEVRLVDTPDFFNKEVKDSQAQVDECKKYCQPGRCVVLLVLQLGRFTDGEREILQRLEDKLGWKIRERTIVLLTHGKELKGSLEKYLKAHDGLRRVVEQCGGRYHLFNNKSKNSQQVLELIEKIPDYESILPMFVKNINACTLA